MPGNKSKCKTAVRNPTIGGCQIFTVIRLQHVINQWPEKLTCR